MSHILHIHLTREIYVLVPPVVRPLPRKKHVTIMNGIHQHASSFMVFLYLRRLLLLNIRSPMIKTALKFSVLN